MKTIKITIAVALAMLTGLWLQSTARADITTGLVGYWKLNDGSGSSTTADSSGNGNTGTLANFADTSFMNMWTGSGPVNNTTLAFNQNGENTNCITVHDSTSLDAPTTAKAWTVAAWVKLSVAGGSQVNNAGIVAKGNLNAEQYGLFIANGGKFTGTMHNNGDTGTELVTNTFTPVANVWYHVAYIFRTSINPEAYIYINGVSNNVGVLNTFTTVYPTNLPLVIGNRYNTVANGNTNNLPFQGTIAEARVYSRALGYGATNSPPDIWQLYTNGLVPPVITAQPRNVNCYSNDTASFAVTVAAPIFGMGYQWYYTTATTTNTIGTPGSATFQWANVTSNANLFVVITNQMGSITSSIASLTVKPLPAADTSSALVGWWKFDDAQGSATAADSSGNNNTGALTNFTDNTFGTTQWVSGLINGALSFNGDGLGLDTVAIPNAGTSGPAVLDFSASPFFTVAAWVDPSLTQSNSAAIICKGTGGGGEQYCLDINSGKFRIFVRDTNGVAFSAQSSLANNGNWQHVAGVLDATNGILNLYINGVLAASGVAPFSLQATNHEVSIGNRQGGTGAYGDAFTGVIDDVRVYHRALTSADVNKLYSANAFPIIVAESPATATNYTLFVGAHTTFKLLSLTGVAPFSYYWFTNGVISAAVTGTNLTLTNVQAGFLTNYCIVSNYLGTATSIVWTVSVVAAPTQPYPAAVLAANPMGYWRLNETNVDGYNNGLPANDYWGGNYGTYSNTLLSEPGYSPTTDPNTTSADFGSAVSSDCDAYAIGGINFGAPTNTSVRFSVEAWVTGNLQSKDAGLVSLGYGGSEQFDLDTGNDTSPISHGFRFFVRDAAGATHSATAPVVPTSSNWQHLVGVCDEVNSNVTIYVNGLPMGTATIAPGAGLLASTRNMLIGSRPSSSTSANDDQFFGHINDVVVYNYALSASQVAAQYSAAGVPPNLAQAPPAIVTPDGNGTLTIPTTAIGTPPFTNTWFDVNGGTNVAIISTNVTPFNAILIVSNVPASWNNDTLSLTVANAYGLTNINVTVVTAPPQIIQDLLPVVIVSGYTFTYSIGVSSLPPLGYQWYNGATPVATGPTYMVTAGAPGSTTYFVVITNVYGATTSAVSTFTSIAPLTNPVATNILSYKPVGYWPMHDIEPPAPGDVETNYGTLGLLGTAYYTDWVTNYGAFNREQSGAIVSDSDSSVYFTSTKNNGGSTTNDLVVAHNSPQTTLNPPFSVECWQYPTASGLQGDVWSQTGFEGLNSGSSEGNGAGAVGGIRLYWGGSGWAIYSYYNSSTLMSPYGNSGYALNQWYHLVVTCDIHTNFSLWVDGVGATNNPGVGLYTPDYWTPFEVGNGRGDTRAVPESYVDEVAIYTNVLSASAIMNHYSTGTNPSPATPYFQVVTNDNPAVYLRMDSSPYTPPAVNTWPAVTNYGPIGGLGFYSPGTMPGALPGPATASGQSFAGGAGANVAALGGVSSYADVGYDTTFDPKGTNAFSVTAMFRCNPCDARTGNWETIVGHSDSSWRIAVNTASGRVGYTIGTGANGTSAGIYNDGNWHQMVAVYTPGSSPNVQGTNLLYVDGALDSLTNGVSTNGISPGSAAHVLIGSDPQFTNNPIGMGRSFAGQICEVALFTNALTASQVQTMFGLLAVPAYIAAQPVSGRTLLSAPTNFVYFGVVAGGASPLAYQWYFNSNPSYSGAAKLVDNVTHYTNSTTSQVTVTNLTTADSGYYFVVVTNNYGSATSLLASLVVTNNVNLTPTNIMVSVSGGQLVLTWPADHTGWRLQAQTNSVETGLGTNWVSVPGTAATNQVYVSTTNACVFYRLVYP